MLKEIRNKDSVEVVVRKIQLSNVSDHGSDTGLELPGLRFDDIDKPTLLRCETIDEFASTTCGIQNSMRIPQDIPNKCRDFSPNCGALSPVNLSKSVLIQSSQINPRLGHIGTSPSANGALAMADL